MKLDNVPAVKNQLGLTTDRVDRLKAQLAARQITYLAADKEAGPFLLYCCGDDIDTIAAKTNVPKDIVAVTALHYRWADKAAVLVGDKGAGGAMAIRREMANTLLIATFVAMQKQLGEVVAGRADASTCPLIPTSLGALEKLMAMVEAVNKPATAEPAKTHTTIIHAENAQVNQQPQPIQLTSPAKPDRLAALRAIGEEKE